MEPLDVDIIDQDSVFPLVSKNAEGTFRSAPSYPGGNKVNAVFSDRRPTLGRHTLIEGMSRLELLYPVYCEVSALVAALGISDGKGTDENGSFACGGPEQSTVPSIERSTRPLRRSPFMLRSHSDQECIPTWAALRNI